MKDSIYEIKIFKDIRRVCDHGYKNFWHEGNGGNLSYRLTQEERMQVNKFLNYDTEWIVLNIDIKSLANDQFIVTGTGVYFMDCLEYPETSFCIIEINSEGNAYRILLNEGFVKPTSEIPAHLLSHNVKVERGLKERCVYHAHTTNVIAASFLIGEDSSTFTKTMWRMSSEMAVVFPEGIGVVGWMVPGVEAIGEKTSEIMKEKNVAVWLNHGTFVSAETPIKAFGLMSTVEKAAMIYIKVLSSGKEIKNTITNENLKSLAKRFNVDISKEID